MRGILGRLAGSLMFVAATLEAQAASGSEPQPVYVPSYDGTFVGAVIRKPAGKPPLPALLFIHGGTGGQSLQWLKEFSVGPVPEHFFRLGYVIMVTDFRRYHFGEDETQDVLAAYRKLQSYPIVDKFRIGVIGGSHGGYLAAMLATRISPAAVVGFAFSPDLEAGFDFVQNLRKTLQSYDDWWAKLTGGGEARAAAARALDLGETETARMRPGARASARDILSRRQAVAEILLDLAWRFGDRREMYQALSPMHNAGKISCPLCTWSALKMTSRWAANRSSRPCEPAA